MQTEHVSENEGTASTHVRVVVLMEKDEVTRLDAAVDALNEAARAKRDPRRWTRSSALRQAAEDLAARALRGRENP